MDILNKYFLKCVPLCFSRHAQVLAALKAWSHWIAQMQASSVDRVLVDRLMSDLVRATVAIIQDHSEPATLVHAAAHLLLSLAGTVKSSQLWNMDQVRSLYSDPLSHLESSVSLIFNTILLQVFFYEQVKVIIFKSLLRLRKLLGKLFAVL